MKIIGVDDNWSHRIIVKMQEWLPVILPHGGFVDQCSSRNYFQLRLCQVQGINKKTEDELFGPSFSRTTFPVGPMYIKCNVMFHAASLRLIFNFHNFQLSQ